MDPADKRPSTFRGKVTLEDFVLKTGVSDSTTATRRSPRLLTPNGSQSATVPATSTKRKSPAEPDALTTPKRAAQRQKSGYAPPSTYAHLSLLPDAIADNLIVLFVGLNPGVQTARSGHAYAHPSNLFWKLLYSSGVTPHPCRPEEDGSMPELFALGLTNIVSRPSRNGAELSKQEMDDGVAVLEEKARKWRPESMCVVGKSIWESIWRVRHGKAIGKSQFKYGWQDESENMGVIRAGAGEAEESWKGARVFVATSTSGLAASLSLVEKESIWRELGSWVEQRRAERLAEKS